MLSGVLTAEFISGEEKDHPNVSWNWIWVTQFRPGPIVKPKYDSWHFEKSKILESWAQTWPSYFHRRPKTRLNRPNCPPRHFLSSSLLSPFTGQQPHSHVFPFWKFKSPDPPRVAKTILTKRASKKHLALIHPSKYRFIHSFYSLSRSFLHKVSRSI